MLMLSRRFAPLFWSQFFSAFNDNFLKTSLVFLILFHIGGTDGAALITLAGAVFIAPYFFLSALGGEIADRYDKAHVAQRLKFMEIAAASVAVTGFWLQSIEILFVALFCFGTIASLFGPIKYGILPDHLEKSQLPTANALIEGATFIAILTGTITGGIAAKGGGDSATFSVLVMGFAVLCWCASLLIPPSGEGAPHLKVSRNIAASTASLIRHLRADSRLWWGAMVTSWFWAVGIVILSLLPPAVKTLLSGDEEAITAYLAIFSIAVGVGSGLAALRARGRIVLSTAVIGAVLLGVFSFDAGFSTYGVAEAAKLSGPMDVLTSARGIRAAIDLIGLAIGGGLYIVPVFAAVQAWAGSDFRARTVAAVNVLNAAAMTSATVLVAILQKQGVTIPMLFLAIGVGTLFVALAIWKTMPRGN